MPELPDVAGFQARFDRHGLRRPVAGLHVDEPRLVRETSAQGLGRRLKDRAFTATHRHGKFLFAQGDGGGLLVLHFGMTGYLAFYGEGEEPPEKAAAVIDFRDGGHLAYVSLRLLGRIAWTAAPEDVIQGEKLGPDALDAWWTAEQFAQRFAERRGMLKSALMNQSLIAGIGNIYSDEILFQCGLPPKTKVQALDSDRLREVQSVTRRVLRTAVRAHQAPHSIPRTYLLHRRSEDGTCPRCNADLASVKVSGRTSYYCPRCQG